MNPPGGVTSDAMCGCPNVLADDAYGSVQGGMCTMLPGYQSVYDPLAAVPQPIETMTQLAPVETTTATVETTTAPVQTTTAPVQVATGAQCYNNTNQPFMTQYGPYPIEARVVAGQVGEGTQLFPRVEAVADGIRNFLGLSTDEGDAWTNDMRKRWNAARGIKGAQVTRSDEDDFQQWLDEVKARYAQYRAEREVPAKAVLGGQVSMGGAGTLVWVLILVAVGALVYMNRKKIMDALPIGKKETTAGSAVAGMSALRAMRRFRRQGL